ncbi:DUF4372 domain-containing protein [Pseudotamlana carrageenivorans]|uniref:Transposase n=1 Tax=Pseudotamlana carrageenivorans TaxID=2069432 RepID=A0A2I7SH58_9FLAO|nr:DUF4372 domain-containing protein [Tamlana carrageenivorans]AUS05238.1 transposase [Tamlana carrageenivorans]
MNKSKNFSGHPIIKQVLNFILPKDVHRTAKKHNSDRYTKKFTTYEHLATMVFTVISGCSSLREVSSIMLACEGKINHLGLTDFPKRSTLSDANRRRSSEVFADIYHLLYKRYHRFLSDSRPLEPAVKNLKIVDSSTIPLFSDILKGVGRNPLNGKKKGGIKMHTMINAMEDVPCLIKFSSAATHGNAFSLRRIAFWHEKHQKVYEFITNNYDLDADKIADIYKNRWQIETMFKRLKQNFPLKYFLGDNQNAIEIQIWVSLIIQLIMLVIQRKAQRNWAYSNMMSVIRYHLMTYIDLFKFLKNPEANWEEITTKNIGQLSLFDP